MTYAKSNGGERGLLVRIWICARVLMLLVALSASSVGAYAATYASRDPEVLLIDASTGAEVSKTMDLFSSAYVNSSSQTVVAASDGQKVVAPGTQGSYAFAVRNSGGMQARYKVWAEASQNGSDGAIPLELSLSSGNLSSDSLSDAGELAPGSMAVYRIGWEWPFEAGSELDARDTALGQSAAAHKVAYSVTVHMQAEADDSAVTAGDMAATGDNMPIAMFVALIGVVLAALVAVAFVLRRRQAEGAR